MDDHFVANSPIVNRTSAVDAPVVGKISSGNSGSPVIKVARKSLPQVAKAKYLGNACPIADEFITSNGSTKFSIQSSSQSCETIDSAVVEPMLERAHPLGQRRWITGRLGKETTIAASNVWDFLAFRSQRDTSTPSSNGTSITQHRQYKSDHTSQCRSPRSSSLDSTSHEHSFANSTLATTPSPSQTKGEVNRLQLKKVFDLIAQQTRDREDVRAAEIAEIDSLKRKAQDATQTAETLTTENAALLHVQESEVKLRAQVASLEAEKNELEQASTVPYQCDKFKLEDLEERLAVADGLYASLAKKAEQEKKIQASEIERLQQQLGDLQVNKANTESPKVSTSENKRADQETKNASSGQQTYAKVVAQKDELSDCVDAIIEHTSDLTTAVEEYKAKNKGLQKDLEKARSESLRSDGPKHDGAHTSHFIYEVSGDATKDTIAELDATRESNAFLLECPRARESYEDPVTLGKALSELRISKEQRAADLTWLAKLSQEPSVDSRIGSVLAQIQRLLGSSLSKNSKRTLTRWSMR